MNCPVLSFLDMREFDMNHTRLISLVSVIQFTIEKSKFKSDSLFVCLFVCLFARVDAVIAVILCFSRHTT